MEKVGRHRNSTTTSEKTLQNNHGPENNTIQRSEKSYLWEKEFISRNSLLTDLLENSQQCRAIQHLFIACFILLFVNIILFDYLDPHPYLDYGLLTWSFGKLHVVLAVWLAMQVGLVILYFGFRFWAVHRYKNQGCWNSPWIVLYLTYIGLFFYFPAHFTLCLELPTASSMIIVLEQVRLLLKTHAFIRSSSEKVTANHSRTGSGSIYPTFSQFVYFLFAPTLVYRDEYPRTTHVRWTYVLTNFAQVAACIFVGYYVMSRLCIPVFYTFGQEPVSFIKMLQYILGSLLPGMITMFSIFFGLFHCWYNAFAEMLRFADRLFYKDWWNATSLSGYHRTWNIVVYDWLYTYVYRDVCKMTGSTFLGKMAVFVITSVGHEYVFILSFKFFLPLIFVLFWMTVPLAFANGKSRPWNIFMLFSVLLGVGLTANCFSMEWYLRANCSSYYDKTYLNKLIPRLWNYDTC